MTEPTVTDAALALGYIDADFFLGGAIALDAERATAAVAGKIGAPLGVGAHEAAAAVLDVVSQNMVHAIEDITINQGVDPREAVLIGGGGAAGLNSVQIARRLGCKRLVIPETGATLSAAGALMSDLSTEFSRTAFTTSDRFERDAVNATLAALEARCRAFLEGPRHRRHGAEHRVLGGGPLPAPGLGDRGAARERALRRARGRRAAGGGPPRPARGDVRRRRPRFRTWKRSRGARGRAAPSAGSRTPAPSSPRPWARSAGPAPPTSPRAGLVDAHVHRLQAMAAGARVEGPAIVESSFTTVVIDPGASVVRSANGNLIVETKG